MSEKKFPESGRTSVKPYSMSSETNHNLRSPKAEEDK